MFSRASLVAPKQLSLWGPCSDPAPVFNGELFFQDLLERLNQVPEGTLDSTLIFELPYLDELVEESERLIDVMEKVQAGRRFGLCRGKSSLLLIDARLSEEWKRVFGPAYFDEDHCYHSLKLPFCDFLSAIRDAENVRVGKDNFSSLLHIAECTWDPLLIRRLKDRLKHYLTESVKYFERNKEKECAAQRALVQYSARLIALDKSFLEELWDFWRELYATVIGTGEQVECAADFISEVFAGHPLTIGELDAPAIEILLRRDVASADVAFRPNRQSSPIPPGVPTRALEAIRRFEAPEPGMSGHGACLSQLSGVRRIAMCLDETSDVDELKEAFSQLKRVESAAFSLTGGVQPPLLQAVFDGLERWPLSALEIHVSQPYAEAAAKALSELLPKLKSLKHLAIRGMCFPLFSGPLPLETLLLGDLQDSPSMEEAFEAICKLAPRFSTLTVQNGEERPRGLTRRFANGKRVGTSATP
jgi:hypothetical protein